MRVFGGRGRGRGRGIGGLLGDGGVRKEEGYVSLNKRDRSEREYIRRVTRW